MTPDLTLTQLRALVSALDEFRIGGTAVLRDRQGRDEWIVSGDSGDPVPLATMLERLNLAPSVPSGWERTESVDVVFTQTADDIRASVWMPQHGNGWCWSAWTQHVEGVLKGCCATEPEAIAAAEAAVERLRGGR